MSNAIIRADLETRLTTWANSQSPPIPIAYENVSFDKTKVTGGVFLEAFIMSVVTTNREVSGEFTTFRGLFQVNVWAKAGTGMRTAQTVADGIAAAFPVFPKDGVVSIESTPHTEHSIQDDTGWVILPVIMRYRYEQ